MYDTYVSRNVFLETLRLSHLSMYAPAITVALYLRISNDPLQLAAGVGRQRTDCRATAEKQWPGEPVVEYVDNDVSASRYSKKAVRPAWRQLLADIESREVTALVGWNFDRLFRQPRELEGFLDLCLRVKLDRVTTHQGDIDLTTHDGMMMARVLTAVAAKASDDASRRIIRANQDRRERGLHQGLRVVFGYQLIDRQPVVVPERADAVRSAAARILDGDSLTGLARDDTLRALGAPQTHQGWRGVLLSPTLTARNAAGVRGSWEPILDDETAARLLALFTAPGRAGASGPRRWWVSGLAFCGLCGGRLFVRTNNGSAWAHGCLDCMKISVRSVPLTAHVELALLTSTEGTRTIEVPQPAPASAAVPSDVSPRLAELASLYVAGHLSRDEWDAARSTAQQDALVERQARPQSRNVAIPPSELRRQWEGLSVAERHARAADRIERVVVSPRARGGARWQPERIAIRWRS